MPADPAKIRELLSRNLAPADVALVVGITPRRVYQIRGVQRPKPRVTDAQRAEIARRRGLGHATRAIARDVGVSRNVVLSVPGAARLYVPQGWTEADAQYVRDRMDAHSASTLARELERPKSSVDTLIARLRREDAAAKRLASNKNRPARRT